MQPIHSIFEPSVLKLISVFVNDKKAVFPTDIILSSLLAACPATMLTVLLLFSSGLTSDDVICSSRKLGLQTNSVNGDTALSYSQGLADFQFMNAYCHQNLVDFAGLFTLFSFFIWSLTSRLEAQVQPREFVNSIT